MEDKNKFDDYIKNLLNEEWSLPDDLQWDQMDIETPEPKKKRRFIFWIPVLAGLGIFTLVFLWWNQQDSTELAVQTEVVATSPKDQSTERTPVTSNKEATTASSTQSASLETPPAVTKTATKDIKPAQTESSKQVSTIPSSPGTATIQASNNVSTKPTEEYINTNKKSNPQNLLDHKKGEEISSTESIISPILDKEKKAYSSKRIISPFDLLDPLAITPLVSIPFSFPPKVFEISDKEIDPKQRKTGFKLAVLGGVNGIQLSIAADSPLADKNAAAYGNSFSLQVQKELKNNFALVVGFGYDELHTTFSLHRDIGTEVDLVRRVRITTCETIFHNNFTNIGSLNVGINKQINIGQRLQVHLGALATPSYILAASGKSLDQDVVIDLADRALDKRLFFSAGINTGVTLKLHKHLHLTSQYQYNLFMGEGLILDDGVRTRGMQRLGLGLVFNW